MSEEVFRNSINTIRDDIRETGHKLGVSSRRILENSPFEIHAGISMPKDLVELTFVFDAGALKKIRLAQETRGFVVTVEGITKSGKRLSSICIGITSKNFGEIFLEVAPDLIDTVLASKNDSEAAAALAERLKLWRQFMETFTPDGMSQSQVTGLFGELTFIELALDGGAEPFCVIDSWTGPDRNNQDFSNGTRAVEVKASAANEAHIITISNLRQLDETGLDQLFLFHAAFDLREDAGVTLPDIIGRILSRLTAASKTAETTFKGLLFAYGYCRSQSDLYRDKGYSVRYVKSYRVFDNFPRIVETDVRAGVSSAKYTIDLAAAASFEISADQFKNEITEFYAH